MSEGIGIALIGLVSSVILAWFTYRSLKLQLKNALDLALIAAKQDKMGEVQKEVQEKINGHVDNLIETTAKEKFLEGKEVGRAEAMQDPGARKR